MWLSKFMAPAVALAVGLPSLVCAQDASDRGAGALGDPDRYMEAARAAQRYVESQYQPGSGLINSVHGYGYATTWDMASGLAALYCLKELGLLDEAEYDRRMSRALATLERMEMFDGAAFNKKYETATGGIAGRSDREPQEGYGWSAMDLGRLLVWLKIVAENDPEYRDQVERVVGRLDFGRLVEDGYLRGGLRNAPGSTWTYQEGRIGYEQYAAAGFALWGAEAPNALDLTRHASPVTVSGQPLLADEREKGHVTSEPFLLMGLELGWTPAMRELAWRLLAAQEERYRRTGQLTMVSEDAINEPPHYFYYYSVHQGGRDFVVDAQMSETVLDGPRWVSAKAAYGWHALLPGEYTAEAVEALGPAMTERGWNAGVYEGSGERTCCENLNTAAVILEAALYAHIGRPLLFETRE